MWTLCFTCYKGVITLFLPMRLQKPSYKNLQCSEIETRITQRVGVVVFLSYSVITLDRYV